jgi:uncharacterized protein (TIGR00251 family)
VRGDRVKVAVTAPPVDGEANAAVIELVAESLGVRRADVSITAGASSRRKTVRVAGVRAAVLAALLGACGHSGTIDITVVTAPGSHILDTVTDARLTLSLPLTVVNAPRNPDGTFTLSLDVTADGPDGDVTFEGLDTTGAVVAYGRTPPLPIAAVDAQIAIDVAAPRSFTEAPVSLDSPRTDMGAGLLDYGVLLAGGRDASGAPIPGLVIYNAYDHSLQAGIDMPAPRAGIAVGTSTDGFAYLFGGTDAGGTPQGNIWRFDTTVAPSGSWTSGTDATSLARADTSIAPLGGDAYLVTGDPPVLFEGLFLRVTAFATPTTLDGGAATITDATTGTAYTLVIGAGAGTSGITRVTTSSLDQESNAPASALRTGHSVFATPAGRIVAIGGADATGPLASAIDCDPVARSYEEIPSLLATPRTGAAATATDAFVVVAGGRDASGTVLGDAEVFDAGLNPVADLPLVVPRADAIAEPLPNGQILIAGGVDATGAPIGTLELFTPDDPLSP